MSLPKLKHYLWLLLLGFVLIGCEGNSINDYDNGYEAAWNGEKATSRFSSKEYHYANKELTFDKFRKR